MKKKFKIWRDDYSETIEDADDFECGIYWNGEFDLEDVGAEYGEFYHSERGGWEANWPIVFSIADETGGFLGKVSVDRQAEPVFYAKVTK